MNPFKRIWIFFESSNLFLWLCLFTVVDIILGSELMKKKADLFWALHYQPLHKWLLTYGTTDIPYTFWFYLFILLIFLIGINTFVCGINKFITTLKIYNKKRLFPYFLKFSSSFIHTGFLILLIAQLFTHIEYTSAGNILTLRNSISLPDKEIKISLKSIDIKFFNKDTKYIGMANNAKECMAILKIKDKDKIFEKKISLNHPIFYKGWAFFIQDFSPKTKGMTEKKFIVLLIKRNKGISILLIGITIFSIGIFMHLVSILLFPNFNKSFLFGD